MKKVNPKDAAFTFDFTEIEIEAKRIIILSFFSA